MTDITERLRLRTDPTQMLMCCPPRPAPDRLCYEAAAEIERLRAALLWYAERYCEEGFHADCCGKLGDDCRGCRARAALAGKHSADAGKMVYEEINKDKRVRCCNRPAPLCSDCPHSVTIRISWNDAAT